MMYDAESLINSGGLLILFLAVYGQIGLFFCFFLPSGGFMFAAGILIATGSFDYSVLAVCTLLTIAAVAGNATGYWFGQKMGNYITDKEDSRFFKQRYLLVGENFYKKHGSVALMIGLFLPIIRTFAPIVAGMIRLDPRRFFLFTSIGSILYVTCFVSTGYLIGTVPLLKPYLSYVIALIVLTVTVPTVIRIVREFRKKTSV